MADSKKKDVDAKAEKAKAFEAALDTYGQAYKAGNISLADTKRVELRGLAGLAEGAGSNKPSEPAASSSK